MSPYFDPTYFDPTYFDTGGAATGGGRGGRIRRLLRLERPVQPTDHEDDLFAVRIL